MGKLITIHPKNILATTEELNLSVVNSILNFFENATTVPPIAPIVIKKDGNHVAVDGHNLLGVCHYLDISCDVYLMDRNEEIAWATIKKERLETNKTYPFDYVMNNNIDLFE